ncbi:MAG: hypothetical protein HYS43_00930 [Candidatus Liptonbacteria bacterium]|nr:hypothetical protein [Candidatus Liptonbacteria bacterium]
MRSVIVLIGSLVTILITMAAFALYMGMYLGATAFLFVVMPGSTLIVIGFCVLFILKPNVRRNAYEFSRGLIDRAYTKANAFACSITGR